MKLITKELIRAVAPKARASVVNGIVANSHLFKKYGVTSKRNIANSF